MTVKNSSYSVLNSTYDLSIVSYDEDVINGVAGCGVACGAGCGADGREEFFLVCSAMIVEICKRKRINLWFL